MANSYSGGYMPSSNRGRANASSGAIKLIGLLGLIGVGTAIAFGRKSPGDLVSAKSGKTWRVILLRNENGLKTYEVRAPASSFGPHEELSVLVYSQMGSDTTSRKIVGVGQGVPVAIVQTAANDFSLPFDPKRMPAGS